MIIFVCRKSINMAPDYRVVLVDPRDPVPDNSQLAKLEQLYLDIVPVLFAIGITYLEPYLKMIL